MRRTLTGVVLASVGLMVTAPSPRAAEERGRDLPVISDLLKHSRKVGTSAGTYQIAPQANTGNVWVIDTTSGALRLCMPPKDKGGHGTPQCLRWGDVRE